MLDIRQFSTQPAQTTVTSVQSACHAYVPSNRQCVKRTHRAHCGLNKMANILRHHFQVHFIEWKVLIKISMKFVAMRPIDNKSTLCQVMIWHWNRQQANTWTNHDRVLQSHRASLCHDEHYFSNTYAWGGCYQSSIHQFHCNGKFGFSKSIG